MLNGAIVLTLAIGNAPLFLPLILNGTTKLAFLASCASDSFISADVVKQTALRHVLLQEPIRVRVANDKYPERVSLCAGYSGYGDPAPETLPAREHHHLTDCIGVTTY